MLDIVNSKHQENLNAKQLETVSRITKAVSQSSPKICLIHGPPGTGKSRVIVNLVTELLYGNDTKFIESNKKILVCAPSNTATDEIVLRLIKIQRKFLRCKYLSFYYRSCFTHPLTVRFSENIE